MSPFSRRKLLQAAPVAAAAVVAPRAAQAIPAPSPELVALFEEFQALDSVCNDWSDEEDARLFPRLDKLNDLISRFPSRSVADIEIKLRVYARTAFQNTLAEVDAKLRARNWESLEWQERDLLSIAGDIHQLAGR